MNTHGMSHTKFYQHYSAMRTRVKNKKSKDYPHYGGRGIAICPRWEQSFLNFKQDMHQKYIDAQKKYPGEHLSINRDDVNGDYCPENCDFIPKKENIQETGPTAPQRIGFVDLKKKTVTFFNSQLEASQKTGITQPDISRICDGKIKQPKNKFFYREDDLDYNAPGVKIFSIPAAK